MELRYLICAYRLIMLNIFVPSFAKVSQRVSELETRTVGSTVGWSQMLTDVRTYGRTYGKPDFYIAPCLRQARQNVLKVSCNVHSL